VRRFAVKNRRIASKVLGSNVVYEQGHRKVAYTRLLNDDDLADLRGIDLTCHLVQQYIDKRFDARCIAIGSRVFTVAIHAHSPEAKIDFRSDYATLTMRWSTRPNTCSTASTLTWTRSAWPMRVSILQSGQDPKARRHSGLWKPTAVDSTAGWNSRPACPFPPPSPNSSSTCAVPATPTAWISLLAPGGVLLTDLKGGLSAGNLVKLSRDDKAALSGRFLPWWAGFMPMHHEQHIAPCPRPTAMQPTTSPPRSHPSCWTSRYSRFSRNFTFRSKRHCACGASMTAPYPPFS
jgi:hypothetical protein